MISYSVPTVPCRDGAIYCWGGRTSIMTSMNTCISYMIGEFHLHHWTMYFTRYITGDWRWWLEYKACLANLGCPLRGARCRNIQSWSPVLLKFSQGLSQTPSLMSCEPKFVRMLSSTTFLGTGRMCPLVHCWWGHTAVATSLNTWSMGSHLH
jgi:hypothetical protein